MIEVQNVLFNNVSSTRQWFREYNSAWNGSRERGRGKPRQMWKKYIKDTFGSKQQRAEGRMSDIDFAKTFGQRRRRGYTMRVEEVLRIVSSSCIATNERHNVVSLCLVARNMVRGLRR